MAKPDPKAQPPAQVRAKIDAILSSRVDNVAAHQAARLAGGAGRYRQVKDNSDEVPADGDTVPAKGHIRSEWQEMGANLPPSLESQLAVHEYEGPLGVGWQIEARVALEGTAWLRVIHAGPEAHRERAWAVE